MKRPLALVFALAFSGCAGILLRHPVTGEFRDCAGPDGTGSLVGGVAGFSPDDVGTGACVGLPRTDEPETIRPER